VDNLTDAQIQANIALVRYLKNKYPTIEYLIGHHEYLHFEGHPLWNLKGPAEIEAEKQRQSGEQGHD